jgi:P4 family phage/plasmid primase-like protien
MLDEVISPRHKNLIQFLSAHRSEGDAKPTHTRIGDKGNIRGGKYSIDEADEDEFYHHYFTQIIQAREIEYLTEKQLGEHGPAVVDLDFRYDSEIRERQHNEDDIQDVISIYLDVLKTMFSFIAATTNFMIYVFEKPEVNLTNDDVTKDGIHIIIGIQMSNMLQLVLRDKVLEQFKKNPNNIDIISDLPLKDGCTWDNVFDEGVSKGSVNWQLYGSRKPHNEAYQLTSAYKITMDESDGEFCTEVCDTDVYHRDIKEFKKLSVRYRDHPTFELTPDCTRWLEIKQKGKKGGRNLSKSTSNSRLNVVSRAQIAPGTSSDPSNLIPVDRITTKEQLEEWQAYVERTLDDSPKNYKKRDAHRYALVLPDKFYGEGSYNEWIRLAFALKNTDELLFITWALVSSKKPGFDYTTIGDLYDTWSKIDKKSDGGLTSKSIMYWAREYNKIGFEQVKRRSLDHYVMIALDNDNDREIAQVLFYMCSERFVCSGLTSNSQIWYEFDNHRWLLDKGMRLRKSGISEELYEVFYAKQVELVSNTQDSSVEGGRNNTYDKTSIHAKAVSNIMARCHSNSQKTHIAKEAAELFWDGEFGDKLDQDKWTLCFTNGIINLQTGEFREGRPLDYISKTTNIPYLDDDEIASDENQKIVAELHDFMSKLFPDESLREYVWEHLASTLVGANLSQTFNIYKGSGSNGKSLLTELMSKGLGEYCNPTAPISIITSKRASLGGTSSELYALKSIRYAVFQEPSKGMVLNEGAMKEMTGDAKIQARELYQTSSSFNQMFSLAVCTNSLFEIKSQDDGTWRRLRIINFMSCFKNDDEYDALPAKTRNSKYIFRKDPNLINKLDTWAPVFTSLLVRRCIKNQGIVKDCGMVLEETNRYRLRQDLIGQFVAERIHVCEGRHITRQALSQTWKMWLEENQASNAPKMTELCEYLSSRYSKHGTAGWAGIEIIYEPPPDDTAF